MSQDPRNRPQRPPRVSGTPAPASETPSQPAPPPSADPRNRGGEPAAAPPPSTAPETDDAGEPVVPVESRPTPVLILPARTLSPGAQPAVLNEVLAWLHQNVTTDAQLIGREDAPDALAAALTENQLREVTQELGDRVRVVADTPIGPS